LEGRNAAKFAAIGDLLIPPVDALPGAGTLAIASGWANRVLDVRPDLRAPLKRALERDPEDFADLLASDPEAWSAMATLVAAAYYAHPDVQDRTGYFGQLPRPQTPDRYPAYIDEGLFDHLLDGEWKRRWQDHLN